MRKFRDTESGEIVTLETLRGEFDALKAAEPEEYDYSFAAYLENCTNKNGFLEEI